MTDGNNQMPTTPMPEYGQMMPEQPTTQGQQFTPPSQDRKTIAVWLPIVTAIAGLIIGLGMGYPVGRQSEALDTAKAAAQARQQTVEKYEKLTKKLTKVVSDCQPTDAWSQTADNLTSHSDGSLTLVSEKYSLNTTLECVEQALDMPSSLTSQIGMTNAYNGVQKENFDEYTVTWSYNGSKGLNLTVAPTMENPKQE
ncbi:hypothetical protein [Bifidobacterium scardovii]|mgnify:CR=1 FL=1|uniref:Uncharacterized protein n=1 Tax=Bifidobacterium scardovii TaxID=158787 RepID=A0A087DGS2_9BIFI|nr:hypothetical protein [Bifidobacterium scardovii]DAE55530.1 MAG TPA: Protein of unknown function (DUF1043) [Caudoviricetes sp.]KFI94722.1 hypothetical protein BSCA_0774 [Bifidobacterium scardovii]MDK6349856.1 hypothetical protein [Bifidobacterium scardovii]MDU8982560.1 hypothetical protein [Bifidobacterium scardovii]BAQ32056.1 hypothetical protein BBSC_1976 [Bifidobacterium scardovii JCM 12489 = DSM 13734]